MSGKTLVKNEYITVEYVADKNLIHHTMHKPVGGSILRDALNIGTETMRTKGAYKWLSDDRLNGPLSKEDVDWGFEDWNRRTIEAGWKYWALVVPEDAINAATMEPTINALYELGLRMMVFSNLEEAMEWLDGF